MSENIVSGHCSKCGTAAVDGDPNCYCHETQECQGCGEGIDGKDIRYYHKQAFCELCFLREENADLKFEVKSLKMERDMLREDRKYLAEKNYEYLARKEYAA